MLYEIYYEGRDRKTETIKNKDFKKIIFAYYS